MPERVICPPGVNVWPSITKPDPEFPVYVEPAMVRTSAAPEFAGLPATPVFVGLRISVLPAITAMVPSGASEIGVPETVISPPSVKVCPAMMNWESPFSVYADPPNTRTSPLASEVGVGTPAEEPPDPPPGPNVVGSGTPQTAVPLLAARLLAPLGELFESPLLWEAPLGVGARWLQLFFQTLHAPSDGSVSMKSNRP